MLETYVKKS